MYFRPWIKEIIKDWENVVLYNLGVENLKIAEYSKLLTTKSFYDKFKSEHVLIFQSDSYVFSAIPSLYYEYDYIGDPWRYIPKQHCNGCDNGGISLRKVETMKNVTTEEGVNYSEDLYFSKQNIKVCTDNKKEHQQFSVEHIFTQIHFAVTNHIIL